MSEIGSLVWAFVLGWIASFTASVVYAWGTRPSFDIRTDSSEYIGQREGYPRHRFFQLSLENREAPYPLRWFAQRNTAWASEVRLDFYHADRPTEKAIADTIMARWSSGPELLQPAVFPTNVSISGQPASRLAPYLT